MSFLQYMYWTFILGYAYKYRYSLLIFINSLYTSFKKYINNVHYLYRISSYKINDECYCIKYSYINGKDYLFYTDRDGDIIPPYTSDEIIAYRKKTNMVKSDSDIIMGDVEYFDDATNKQYSKDGLALCQMLSGPLGNFYKDKPNNKFSIYNLERSLKFIGGPASDLIGLNIQSLSIMDSSGDTYSF